MYLLGMYARICPRPRRYVGIDGKPLPHYAGLPNANMRLYGGAQYHRAIVEFRHVVGQIKCPSISREEIVNACGIDDVHDGVNYTRAACVIAINKAKDVFEPFLYQLGYRLSHVRKATSTRTSRPIPIPTLRDHTTRGD